MVEGGPTAFQEIMETSKDHFHNLIPYLSFLYLLKLLAMAIRAFLPAPGISFLFFPPFESFSLSFLNLQQVFVSIYTPKMSRPEICLRCRLVL